MENQAPSRRSFDDWASWPKESVFRAFWIFAALLFGFRLLVLAVIPFDLSGDEAYYWEWSQHLDWGYFSKPPGIAWLMALTSKVGGDTTFGIRMFAALLGTGSLICLFRLAWRLYGPAVAMITGIAFVANPANAALNLVLTIDAPLMFFWTLSLWVFWEFIQAGSASDKGALPRPPASGSRLRWGLLLFLGLAGGMLSKLMMLAFLPLAVLFLIFSKDRRAQLRRPGLWFVLLGSLVALLPTLWWNRRNDWLTLRHTMHHFESSGVSLGRQAGRFCEYLGAQCGIITPMLYLLLMGLVIAVPWCWKRLGDRERFLWIFGGPPLLIILFLSWRQPMQPNWPAVFYASTSILLTGWAAGKWSLNLKLDHWRWTFKPGLRIAVGIAVLVHGAVFALAFGWISLPGLDPTARLRGWSQLAHDVEAIRRELPGGQALILVTRGHRFMTSELAFYLPDHPRVYLYNEAPHFIRSQHDLWETPAARLGEDALIIIQGEPQSIGEDLKTRFESLMVHSVLRYPRQSASRQVVTLAVGRNLLYWPPLRDRRSVKRSE